MPKGNQHQGRVGVKGGFNTNSKKNVKMVATDPNKDKKSLKIKGQEQRDKAGKLSAQQKVVCNELFRQ